MPLFPDGTDEYWIKLMLESMLFREGLGCIIEHIKLGTEVYAALTKHYIPGPVQEAVLFGYPVELIPLLDSFEVVCS